MRIRPGLHMVFSGAAGFDLSHPCDCNAYLLDTGEGWALIDAGAGVDPAAAVAAIDAEGIGPRSVRWLLLTHAHADHAGGAAGLRGRLGLEVVAAPATAALVRAGDKNGIHLDRAIDAGVFPPTYSFHACEVDRVAEPGESVKIGALTMEVIPAAGHSHDHVCLRVRQGGTMLLFSGDALFSGGKVVLQDLPDCSVIETCNTIRRLERTPFDALLPGHGAFSLARAHRHVEAALARVLRLLAPESFF